MTRHFQPAAALIAVLLLLLTACSTGEDTVTSGASDAPTTDAPVASDSAPTADSGDEGTEPSTSGSEDTGDAPAAGSEMVSAEDLPDACSADSPRIAVALPNLTNPYYVAMQRGFEEAGDEAGFTTDIQIAGDDDANQLAQVQAMLQNDPCALALNAVKSDPAAAIVKLANDAGVPVFSVNVIISEEALQAQDASVVQYLGADNVAGGEQVGQQVLDALGEDAEIQIGLITEPDEVPVVLRDQGFSDVVSANPNAEIVAEVDGNVNPEDSLQATTELLSGNPDVDVLFASTGPAAFGALQAIISGGFDGVQVFGFCASEELLTDQYPGCVAQEPESYGRQVIQQVSDYIAGDEVPREVLNPLKTFTEGETPAPGEVG